MTEKLRLTILCVYQYLPVSSLKDFWSMNSLCSINQSKISLIQNCFLASLSIKCSLQTISRSSKPALVFGWEESQILHILWIWTKHLCTGTFGHTFLIAFKRDLSPSQVIPPIFIPRLMMFCKSSFSSSWCSASVIL